MTTLKVKTKSGMVQDIQVERLLEIDGQRYCGPDTRVDQIERRLDLIEQMLTPEYHVTESETVSVAS